MAKRGRPPGYRLSEESKRAIAESKTGQCHKKETKDKISKTLLVYFKQFNSFGEEIINKYCRADDDKLCEWANQTKEDLDDLEDVFTSKTMRNKRKMELTSGQHIEFYSHDLTPEALVILKQIMEQEGNDLEKAMEIYLRED